MVVYYLISLLGESLVRTNSLSAFSGEWLGNIVIVGLSLVLLKFEIIPRFGLRKRLLKNVQTEDHEFKPTVAEHTLGVGGWGFPSLLDTNLFSTLATSFMIGFVSLVSIFIIFTLFEIWRLISSNHIPLGVVARYLLFLLPLVAVELFPATMLITVLISYALLARRSEAIAWWASGQSVYRLMIPGLLFAMAVGAVTWLVQEHVMPAANVKQDALRTRIKGGQPRAITGTGRQWLASAESKRLYSYEFDEEQGTLNDPTIYELDDEGVHLSRVKSGKLGYWIAGEVQLAEVDPPQVFRPTVDKPSQLSVVALSSYLKAAKTRGVDVSALALALQRKYVNPFSVVVMAFIGMPLALAFGRRGALVALCVAVGVSVAYWGIGGGFQQLGNHGLLPPEVAAWAPPIIFAAAGIYFLSRVRT
jgi:lipopolysaccharide export LptBFGC system permease protein LptF